MQTQEEIRKEANRESFKRQLREMRGDRCAGCGERMRLEQHHIVPISYGGTNLLSNVVLLCHKCHMAAHMGHAKSLGNNGGRPKKQPPNGYEAVLDKYFAEEIGARETRRLLRLSTGTKLSETWWINEYREKHNIPSNFRNTVDVKRSQEKRIRTRRLHAKYE